MSPSLKKGLIFGGLLAVLLLTYYVVFAEPRSASAEGEGATDLDASSGGGEHETELPPAFPLKRGSRGENVRSWQKYVFMRAYPTASASARTSYADGIFGPKTEADTLKVTGSKTVDLATFLDAVGGGEVATRQTFAAEDTPIRRAVDLTGKGAAARA